LFDSWYLAEELVAMARYRNKDWISLLKKNRNLELGFYQFTQPLVPLSRLYGEPWDFFGSFAARSL